MDFFRKYQKPILYVFGIFALVTFSANASIMDFFGSLFQPTIPRPTVTIGSGDDVRVVEVTAEDDDVAVRLVRRMNVGDPTVVMPVLFSGDDSPSSEVVAALRRLAIEYGIDASAAEVRRAIELGIRMGGGQVQSVNDLARAFGQTSTEYLETLREELRIATFVRVQALAADTSDASIAAAIAAETEILTLRIATIDGEAIEAELKAKEVTDEQLHEWVDGLEELDRSRLQYVDRDRYRVDLAAIVLDDFDPTAFGDELGETTFSDEEVQVFYDRNKFRLFRKPAKQADDKKPEDGKPEDGKPGDVKPGDEKPGDEKPGDEDEGNKDEAEKQDADKQDADKQEGDKQEGDEDQGDKDQGDQDAVTPTDADVKPVEEPQEPEFHELDDTLRVAIRKRLVAEKVVHKLWDEVRSQIEQHVAAEQTALDEQSDALAKAQATLDETMVAANADGAGDAEKEAVTAAEQAVKDAEAAIDAAKTNLSAARAAFDLGAVWTALAKERGGFKVIVSGDNAVTVDQLADLPELGKWEGSAAVAALRVERPLSSEVQHNPAAVFGVRLIERVASPLKAWDDIVEKARGDYFTEKADERAEELAKEFEKKLDELAREQAAEAITTIETKLETDTDTELEEWRTRQQTDLDTKKALLATLGDPALRAYRATQAAVERIEKELGDPDAKRTQIRERLKVKSDEEIAKKVTEQKAGVFGAAAEQAGVTVAEYGPFPRDLSRRGEPREIHPKPVRYMWWFGQSGTIKDGAVTELLQDFSNRAWHVAVATKVEKGSIADLTRRQFQERRESMAGTRRVEAIQQSFSLEALKERYGWLPGGRPIETGPKSAKNGDGAGDPPPSDG